MFRIDPDALYTRAGLGSGFQELGIDFDAWVARAKPVKRFRLAWLGSDLLDAIRAMADMRNRGDGNIAQSGEKVDKLIDLPKAGRRVPRKAGKGGDRAAEIAGEMRARLGMN